VTAIAASGRDFVDPEPDHPLGPLKAPGAQGGLGAVFRRRYLLKLLVKKELNVRYQGSLVGMAWSYVKPATRFIMYFWVIGLLLGNRLPGRAVHIFAGLIILTFFTDSMTAGSRSVVRNASLVRKINLPREMFPIASLLVTIWHLLPMYLMVVVGCLIAGWHPDLMGGLAGVLGFVNILVWGTSIALLFSAWNVFHRDVQNFTETIQQVIMWMVPMIYSWEIVNKHVGGGKAMELYTNNPLTLSILMNQRCFWWTTLTAQDRVGTMPSHLMYRGAVSLLVGCGVLVIAQRGFARAEGHFAEAL
jgi:ABC-2 type transport system permease protein